GFDFHGVANDVFVETALERHEVGIVLAPGFEPASGDGDAANKTQFLASNLALAGETEFQRRAYRHYVVDECDDGHWSIADSAWETLSPFNFPPLFPDDDEGKKTWVKRYRPGKATLFSKDLNNKPLKASLAISTDYAGHNPPCFWSNDDTAT